MSYPMADSAAAAPLTSVEEAAAPLAPVEEAASVVAPLRGPPRGGARSYRAIDVAEAFALRSSGKRNRTGAMIWDVARDRNPINFHALGENADKWSDVIWEIKTEADDNRPLDRIGLTFRISPQQLAFIQAVEARLIDQITEKSHDILGKAIKRDIIENMYQSPLNMKEGHDPAMRIAMTVRGYPAFLTRVYYYRALPQGGWETTAQEVSGWEDLEPLIASHRCRYTKIRGSFRVGGLQVIGGKTIAIRWEFAELHMRAPAAGGAVPGQGYSAEERLQMQGLE